jgi:hypothetical protein
MNIKFSKLHLAICVSGALGSACSMLGGLGGGPNTNDLSQLIPNGINLSSSSPKSDLALTANDMMQRSTYRIVPSNHTLQHKKSESIYGVFDPP